MLLVLIVRESGIRVCLLFLNEVDVLFMAANWGGGCNLVMPLLFIAAAVKLKLL